MSTVTSQDGTTIAYDRRGSGPALVIVPGVLATRALGSVPALAGLLANDFTVVAYDRRGKGDSGDTRPYAVDREIEDLEALIDAAGGEAFVYGHSSGGALALLAAAKLGGRVARLALYEVPYTADPRGEAAWKEYVSRLAALLADGRNGDAVALFLQLTGLSADQVAGMRQAPFWPAMEAGAPTLAYDHIGILGPTAAIPADLAAAVTVPTLVMSGGASLPFMRATAERLSGILPHARLRIVEGQAHNVSPEVLAPILAGFFRG
ncbi:MAG: alpha/beta hydrolase [Methanospirillum sp.]